jgi:hypothetical protein
VVEGLPSIHQVLGTKEGGRERRSKGGTWGGKKERRRNPLYSLIFILYKFCPNTQAVSFKRIITATSSFWICI